MTCYETLSKKELLSIALRPFVYLSMFSVCPSVCSVHVCDSTQQS